MHSTQRLKIATKHSRPYITVHDLKKFKLNFICVCSLQKKPQSSTQTIQWYTLMTSFEPHRNPIPLPKKRYPQKHQSLSFIHLWTRVYRCTYELAGGHGWSISWVDLLGVQTCVLGRRHGWKRGGFLGRTCWAYIPVYLAEDMGGSVEDFLGGPVGHTYLYTWQKTWVEAWRISWADPPARSTFLSLCCCSLQAVMLQSVT